LHCARCHFSHLCCHLWQVSSVFKPESFPCLLVFEIQIPFIYLQPEVQVKIFQQTKLMYCENQDSRQRKEQDKKACNCSEYGLCFSAMSSGKKKCSVLQKLVMGIMQLRVHRDT
jgi:hypothetical protein